ncbi:MAG: hypothetical protein ROZ09_15240 [Thiobacillus sp.]|uniref:hypothetical protein n=1 Tax=Thiobacillus sp. TaxID=924 RepID=UPI00289414FF|nr:hypothetical protein [Thiobacillus sp.]MDT3708175.1 hypothetical protein [Thiobacillus sp.]
MTEQARIELSAVDKTRAAFDSLKNNLKSAETQSRSLSSAMGMLVPSLTLAGLAAVAKSSIDAADALNDMSQRTQVSVKDLASFKLAAEQSGTSLESVGKAIQRLNLSVSQAATDKGMAESLRNLGITSTDARERLFQLADAYAKSGGQGRQLADMQKVLSKSYADTLPLLSQGSQALRDSAIAAGSYSDAMAKLAPDADKFNDELARMKINSAGAGAAILTDIVPPMADWLGSVNVLIERYGVLTGVLAGIGAAAVPGITAGDLAGDVSVSAFKRQLEDAKDELKTIEAATKSGTFGLIQLALYGSEADMRRKGEYLRGNIKTLEESIAQFEARGKAKPNGVLGDNGQQLACVAGGGTWDGTRCIPKPAKGGGHTIDKEALAAEDLAAAWKQAGDELQRYQDDLAFMADVDLAQMGGVNDIAQQWADAGRALTDDMMTPLEKANVEFGRLDELLARGVISWETYGRAVFKTQESLDQLPPKISAADEAAQQFGVTFTSALEDAIVNGEAVGDMLKGLEQDLARMIVRMSVTEPLMAAVKGTDWGSVLGNLFANADGGVYSSPGLSAYSGSVVDRPTLFPFAAGAGLMGEAGAEGIFPLKRGADGKLGVQASGGGGVQVNVINNAGGTQATATEREENGVRIVDVMVEQVEGAMSRRLGRGEGLAPVMERRYGLNPAAGAY